MLEKLESAFILYAASDHLLIKSTQNLDQNHKFARVEI